MLISRREFMNSIAVFSAVGMAPRFLTAAAAEEINAIEGFKDDRVLVVVQLGGGNDGLNTVVPHGNDDYYRARPNLGLRGDGLLKLNDEFALNGSMAGLMKLYDAGKLGIVQGVGYPNPDRSHFRSMEIWHTASESNEYLSRGWIGRYFDNCCDGAPRPQVGMAIGERPQAFDGEKGFGISATDPNKFGWQPGRGQDLDAHFNRLNEMHPSGNDTLDFLQHTATNAILSSKEVQKAAKNGGVEAPGKGGGRKGGRYGAPQLDTVAGLIRGGLQTRIYYVSVGGFDTHVDQASKHARLLETFADSMAAFQAQLEADGTADRVTTMVFSEFGRRVHENGGGGTDHGTAAPMFLIGNHVKAGLHGKAPSLTDLDDGDMKYNVDFRSVYASVLDNWFAADSSKVLGKKFDTLGVIA